MIDINTFKSLKASWIKKYLDPKNNGKWSFFYDSLKMHGGKLIFSCNLHKDDISLLRISNPFVCEVLSNWAKLNMRSRVKSLFYIILSDGCYTQFPVRILPPTWCMLAGVRLAVIGSDLHKVERGLFNYSPDRISPIKPPCMEYMWVTFCRFLVENFCVDSRSKSLPLEAIGISRTFKQIGQVRRIQASLLKTGDGQPTFFTLVQCEANSALDQ